MEINNRVRPELIQPGMFGGIVSADMRRNVFDYKNEVILRHQKPIDFVFIGDSITDMWDIDSYFKEKYRLVNRGIGGDMTSFAKRRFQADVMQLRPKYTVIQIGINNTWALDEWQAVNRKTSPLILEEIVRDILEMAETAVQADIQPIVGSLLPTCIHTNKQTKERNELVCMVNRTLQQKAEQKSFIFVNYHAAMTDDTGMALRQDLADDGLHPHVVGYDIMAAVLRNTLQQHGITI